MSGDGTPRVPDDHLDGWAVTDRSSETVFELPVARVVGHTAVYDDDDLRSTVTSLTGGAVDRMWRFFFATRLEFTPTLPPTIGPAAVFTTVRTQANSVFRERLQERGFDDISKAGHDRIRVDSGDRASLQAYDAAIETSVVDVPVEGYLAVWSTGGEFRLAGGAYPAASLSDLLGISIPGIDIDPDSFRKELLTLVKSVR
ncbi:hypothetical protein BV210_04185 [Halorientalis sp. IM1011]|uniref:hypothetical protein n=1 Tax=Halorientalis sp. IM1011 TaxID=1932360 RepID=UPI00097CD2F5|nr:hypothetical protein [Halorientalis sp. IM1011]AQL41963.1 hypothetical protein BV210_04185 [Halorientalis sp. IM1011]